MYEGEFTTEKVEKSMMTRRSQNLLQATTQQVPTMLRKEVAVSEYVLLAS